MVEDSSSGIRDDGKLDSVASTIKVLLPSRWAPPARRAGLGTHHGAWSEPQTAPIVAMVFADFAVPSKNLRVLDKLMKPKVQSYESTLLAGLIACRRFHSYGNGRASSDRRGCHRILCASGCERPSSNSLIVLQVGVVQCAQSHCNKASQGH